MVKSRLIALLSTFTEKEINEFEKFIASPYFSSGRDLKPFFNELKKYYPSFSSTELNEEFFYSKLFKEKKFSGKKSQHAVQVLISELHALCEKFLVHNRISAKEKKYLFNSILAESYRDKNLMSPVIKLLLKNSEILKDKEAFNNPFALMLENNMSVSGVFYTLNKPKESYEFSRNNLLFIYANLFDVMNKFANDYFVNKYTYNFEYQGFELIKDFVESFNTDLFNSYFDNDEFETKNLTLINYYMLRSRLNENDKDSLIKIIGIYGEIFNNLTRENQWLIYAQLFNRLYGRIRISTYYLHKANDLIDLVWGNGVLSPHKKINLHIGSYHSALMVKAALLDKSGISIFIENYCRRTGYEYHKSLMDYSEAVMNFKDKNYIIALRKVSQKDNLNFPLIKINKHKIKICSLIELNFSEESFLAIDSFDHFIRKNKNVSEIVKSENIRFISGIKKYLKIRLGELSEPDFEMNKIIELNRNSLFGYWFEEKSGLNKNF